MGALLFHTWKNVSEIRIRTRRFRGVPANRANLKEGTGGCGPNEISSVFIRVIRGHSFFWVI